VVWRPALYAAPMVLAGVMATPPADDTRARHDAMEKLADLLVGRWQGSFRLDLGKPPLYDVTSTFAAAMRADGTLLTLDVSYTLTAVGQTPDSVPHSEFALLYFEPVEKRYHFELCFADGKRETGLARLEASVLQVTTAVPGGGYRRLTIDRSVPDVWHETGERSPDGVAWRTYLDARFRRLAE
jgi:hypothetical protein